MYYAGFKVAARLTHQLLSKVESGGAEGRPVPRPAAAEDADGSHRSPPATAAALRSLLLVLVRLHALARQQRERGETERDIPARRMDEGGCYQLWWPAPL